MLKKNNGLEQKTPLGVYLHIPFCAQICHYCDFAKTANYHQKVVDEYFSALKKHLALWLKALTSRRQCYIASVFIGGGTPSLFTAEYLPIMELLYEYGLSKDIEVSLEVNPNTVTKPATIAWKKMGINRISLGVQSFIPQGLKVLTRDHSKKVAVDAYYHLKKEFKNISIDLIFGWPTQQLSTWQQDLTQLLALKPQHISLYSLTYEHKTPMGRAFYRGRIKPIAEDHHFLLYQMSCNVLGAAGFYHEEVSNWVKFPYTSIHNWHYWRNRYYIAVGSGASGFIPGDNNSSNIGVRYLYPKNERQLNKYHLNIEGKLEADTLRNNNPWLTVEQRDLKSLIIEYIANGLRTTQGVPIDLLAAKLNCKRHWTYEVQEAFKQGLMFYDKGWLRLSELEWWREHAWCSQIINCLY